MTADQTNAALALFPDDPWLVAEADYPVHGTEEEQLAFLVGYAVLAPSRYNAQPWTFRVVDGALELLLDESHLLPVTDARGREATQNCGTALYYLRTAAAYFGHEPLVELLPDLPGGDLLARVRLGMPVPPSDSLRALFGAIRHRRTWERRFLRTPLPKGLRETLCAAAAQENASLVFLDMPEERRQLADLIALGEDDLRQNPDYGQEAAVQTARNRDATWLSALTGLLRGSLPLRRRDPGGVLSPPAVAVLCSEGDTPADWLNAGLALGAVLLTADAAAWVGASLLNQPVEALDVRPALQALVGGRVPQLILRLGRAPGRYRAHRPRRGVRAVLETPP